MTTGEGGFVTTNDDRLADWHPALPQPGHAPALPPRDARLQLPDDRHRGRDRARPVRQAGAEHGPPAGHRRPLRRGVRRPAGPLPVTPDGRTHVFHQYTIDVGRGATRSSRSSAAAGIGAGIYYPIPVHRQAYVMERGLHADLPVTDAAAARTLSLPMFPGLTDEEQDDASIARPCSAAAVAGQRRRSAPPGAPTASSPPDDRRAPAGPRDVRVGLAGPRRDGPQPPAGALVAAGRAGSPRSPTRSRRRSPPAVEQSGAQGVRGAPGDDRGGRARRARHRRPDDRPRRRSRSRRSSAVSRSSSRSRSRRRSRRGCGSSPRAARPRRPGPGRPRRAVQPGRPRARPAARRGLALSVFAIACRRAGPVPGPDPRRRRDRRPRDPRRRHPVVDRRRAAAARLRRDRPADPRRPRGPAVRAAPLPVGRDRHARRQLADARQAPPARRRRRGRHVRARLPDPAPDVHEGADTTQPAR